jgi:hypothetical protein
LAEVRDTVLAFGARRAERTSRTEAPEDLDADEGLNAEETTFISEQTLRISAVLAELLEKLRKGAWLTYRSRRRTPKDIRGLRPLTAVELRSEPGLLQRPLVSRLIQSDHPLTAEGFRSWWDDAILVPDWKQRAARRSTHDQDPGSRTERLRGRERRRQKELGSLTPAQRKDRLIRKAQARSLGLVARVLVALPIVVVVCLLFGSVGFSIGDEFKKGGHRESTHVASTILSDHAKDWVLKSVIHDVEITYAYRPLRMVIMDLPQRRNPDDDYAELPELTAVDGHQLTRQMVQRVRQHQPELYDTVSGDLKRDVVVIGLARPPSDGTSERGRGDAYDVDAWAWGPLPTSERGGGYPSASPPGSHDDSDTATVTVWPPHLMAVFGTPNWTTSPASGFIVIICTVGLVVIVFTFCVWLWTKPWKAWGANGRRRRTSERSLTAATAALQAGYSREDEAELDALMVSRATAPAERRTAARSGPAGTGTNGIEGDVEAERRRVSSRARAVALRRAEELAGRSKQERTSRGFAAEVTELGDLATALADSDQHTRELAERTLSTGLPPHADKTAHRRS